MPSASSTNAPNGFTSTTVPVTTPPSAWSARNRCQTGNVTGSWDIAMITSLPPRVPPVRGAGSRRATGPLGDHATAGYLICSWHVADPAVMSAILSAHRKESSVFGDSSAISIQSAKQCGRVVHCGPISVDRTRRQRKGRNRGFHDPHSRSGRRGFPDIDADRGSELAAGAKLDPGADHVRSGDGSLRGGLAPAR